MTQNPNLLLEQIDASLAALVAELDGPLPTPDELGVQLTAHARDAAELDHLGRCYRIGRASATVKYCRELIEEARAQSTRPAPRRLVARSGRTIASATDTAPSNSEPPSPGRR